MRGGHDQPRRDRQRERHRAAEAGRVRRSNTPGGVFAFYRRVEGVRQSAPRRDVEPVYFNYGIAIHGALNVPLEPASHGCIRIPLTLSEYFQSSSPMGDQVYVFDGVAADPARAGPGLRHRPLRRPRRRPGPRRPPSVRGVSTYLDRQHLGRTSDDDEATSRLLALLVPLRCSVAACGQKAGVAGSEAAEARHGDRRRRRRPRATGFDAPTATGSARRDRRPPASTPPRHRPRPPHGATTAGPFEPGADDTAGVTDDEIVIGIHAPVTGASPIPQTSFDIGKDIYWQFLAESAPDQLFGRNVRSSSATTSSTRSRPCRSAGRWSRRRARSCSSAAAAPTRSRPAPVRRRERHPVPVGRRQRGRPHRPRHVLRRRR